MKPILESNPVLAAAISSHLPEIDAALSADGRALTSRPMEALEILLDNFLELQKVPPGNRYEQKWFAILFAIVANWYETKYGTALHAKLGMLVGVVEIHKLPFKVGIAPTYSVPHPSGQQSTLCFGPALGNTEKPREWLTSPPNLSTLKPAESKRLDRDLAFVTKTLRSIHLNFMMGYPAPQIYTQHRGALLLSMRKAAEHIAGRTEEDYSSAVWETHFAVENALKAIIAQTGAQPVIEHKLTLLVAQARSEGISLDVDGKLGFLPSAGRAIDSRYGRPLPNGYRDAISIYKNSLPLLAELSSYVKRSMEFGEGVSITFNRPPWFEFLE